MAKRPTLAKGDLVKRKKPNDDGRMYRVVRISFNRAESFKLGRPMRNTSEGWLTVHVCDINNWPHSFKRRELWRVPNQPRHKKNV